MHTYKIAPYLKIIKVQRRYTIIILESRRCTKYDDVIMGENQKFCSALPYLYIYLYLESGHIFVGYYCFGLKNLIVAGPFMKPSKLFLFTMYFWALCMDIVFIHSIYKGT